METFNTKYGKITLRKNEKFIGSVFRSGKYWDEDTLLSLQQYIDPDRNILELGGHAGTSTIVYASFLNKGHVDVYEPQRKQYKLLNKNIYDNDLEDKICPHNAAVFCFEGNGKMNNIDLDGGGSIITEAYDNNCNTLCNFGGLSLGSEGEEVRFKVVDKTNISNIGYIHADLQGAEPWAFYGSRELIKRDRPVILYENISLYGKYFYNLIKESYPEYKKESEFDIKKYCMEELGYSKFIDRYGGKDSIDTLLLP